MGCLQSKANQPMDKDKVAKNGSAVNPNDSENVCNEHGRVDGSGNQDEAPHTPVVRKELDIKPPPVKAIPKVVPKAIPRKKSQT